MKKFFFKLVLKILGYFGVYHHKFYRYKNYCRAFYFKDLYEKINNLDGAVVECGVGYGESLTYLGVLSRREGKNRKVYGFDSFVGFPETDFATESKVLSDDGRTHTYEISPSEIKRQLEFCAADKNVTLVKGFFKDVLPGFDEKIVFLHIDADLYDSYVCVLENLLSKVVKGGIVAFDEYEGTVWVEAKNAIHKFFRPSEIIRDKYYHKYYAIKQ